ncbi:MAG: bifunctional phosphopantothenoylcysteine decarboxylase/phosphopantothenate--cysteine ligase CoaBC [Deltaproteobacteria bacterium]|nr:bifunctional phosphopantothenoylcysteine decarboxylase/phosphopantothenate--cysteine ligase CoaBC [Deltaproteobacteria bacterium]
MSVLQDKKIVLGVTGCIAVYKAAELVRQLVKLGADVHVVMTESAREFMAPLTFQTLSGNPVITEMFKLYEERKIGHITMAQRGDIVVVAPATANIIGKAANGIADEILSTVLIATRKPVLFAPAMNEGMWEHPAVMRNVQMLKDLGRCFVEPGSGDLACGDSGRGRLADIADIVDEIELMLSPSDFTGTRALVTAGPTQEFIDPVRFISNPSSGKMGYALARALRHRGADVVLISGPTMLPVPRGVHTVHIGSAQEMAAAVDTHFPASDIIIKAAAVADYRPRVVSMHKVKKNDDAPRIDLERTTDILADLGNKKGKRLLVGFAAETQDVLANARGKLERKNLDLIVANDVTIMDGGFGSDMNKATLLLPGGETVDVPAMTKQDLAHRILDCLAGIKLKLRDIPDEPA